MEPAPPTVWTQIGGTIVRAAAVLRQRGIGPQLLQLGASEQLVGDLLANWRVFRGARSRSWHVFGGARSRSWHVSVGREADRFWESSYHKSGQNTLFGSLRAYDETMFLRFRWIGLLAIVACIGLAFGEDCIPITEARQHIGKTRCVTGKVVKVTRIPSGTHFLNFCQDYRTCPFQVVVFRGDLKHVGDVRQLEGRIIQIHGDIKDYDGRPEIVLKHASQLKGEAARIPPLPKKYDVENKGRYSAGRFKHPKATRQPAPKPPGRPIETEEPEDQ
jgi:hypothetical protein